MAAPNYDVVVNPNPADAFAAVTPSDSINLSRAARALYVGGSGNVALLGLDGLAVTFNGLAAGTILPVRFLRVNATNTTATNLVALW